MQMGRDLTKIAKDMLQHQDTRLMTLRNGRWSQKIAARFAGLDNDEGMPVALIEALSHTVDDLFAPFAMAKLRYDAVGPITKSPGKKAFSEVKFDPPADRGFELARAFTKWIDVWVPNYQHCLIVGKGDAFLGARARERVTDRFVRTSTVIDLSQHGIRSAVSSSARLMLSPIVATPSQYDEVLVLDHVFSLHRTMPDGSTAPDVIKQVEEELLIGATVAWDKGGETFTAFDVAFGRPANPENSPLLLRALIQAMLIGSKTIKGMPTRFRSPLQYSILNDGLGARGQAWNRIGEN